MTRSSPRRIGLVLGGAGAVGAGFHRGVLAAIDDVTDFDVRNAEIVIGTSSGATIAGLLRAGLGGKDLAASACGEAVSASARRVEAQRVVPEPIGASASSTTAGRRIRRRADPWTMLGAPTRRSPTRLWPASGRGVLTAARRQGVRHPGAMLGALLPAGPVPTISEGGPLDRLFPTGWPHRSLWICAVRVEDGSRVLFGRPGDPVTDVPTAVAASCALPGWFTPVAIDGVRYVDGAVWSATNADALVGEQLDLVVISAPLSGDWSLLHRWQGRQLRREAARLRSSGTSVLLIEPTRVDVAAMGWNIMDRRRRPAVTRHMRASVAKRLISGDLAGGAALL